MIKARDLVVAPCPREDVKNFIETHHYSHSINGVKVSQCFSVRASPGGELVGAVLFGQLSTTAWKRFGANESEVLELRRLVLLDECGKNSESRVISKCLKWVRRNMPIVCVIVSYADPTFGHTGVIYRASNFKKSHVSPADTGFFDPETGKVYHSRALRTKYKGRYKPFVLRLREKLEKGILKKIKLKGKICYIYRF